VPPIALSGDIIDRRFVEHTRPALDNDAASFDLPQKIEDYPDVWDRVGANGYGTPG
jgi:hypothetical protein